MKELSEEEKLRILLSEELKKADVTVESIAKILEMYKDDC